MYNNGLFIFRRDLRIIDNKGLNFAATKCKNIFTVFIFTPEQVTSNAFKSDRAITFMAESLKDLRSEINKSGGELYHFYGKNEKIIPYLISELNIDCIFFNRDITEYALKRDKKILKSFDNTFIIDDYYLLPIGSILNTSGKIYTVFTPFYHKCLTYKIDKPHTEKINFVKTSKKLKYLTNVEKFILTDNIIKGGRSNVTTPIGSYIKFGCVSIREVYYKSDDETIRKLFWRDFYANILYNNKPKKDPKWPAYKDNLFQKWKTGKTEFPLINASQMELIKTGWTCNRLRMLSAYVLTIIYGIDWRKGEKFYAKHLIDYDPASNRGGWRYSIDELPEFKSFNIEIQTKKFDPDGSYVKKWLS